MGAIAGTLSVLVTNLVLLAAFVGLGVLIRRAFGLGKATLQDTFVAFWMGFALTIATLIAWNFFWPISAAALQLLVGAGLAALVGCRKMIAGSLSGRALAACGLFMLWVAHVSIGTMTEWDTALYHMQGVTWAGLYPVVPGVANVFGPMGFNNASFLYNAMLDTGMWRDRAWHVSNGVLVSAFGCQIITAGARLTSRPVGRPSDLFMWLLLPAATSLALDGRVSSFATAVPSALLLMVAAGRVYDALASSRTEGDRAYDWFSAIVLCAAAVTIKSSAGVFAAAVAVLLIALNARRGGLTGAWRRRAWCWSAAATVVVGALWVIRGVILSGYPLFPVSILPLPVDWRVPVEHARAEFDFVVHSARATAENMAYVAGDTVALGFWLPHWGRTALSDLYEIAVPLLIGTLACLSILRHRSPLASARDAVAGWWLLVPTASALVLWFVTAPMPRYGAPLFWIAAALLGSQAFALSRASRLTPRRVYWLGLVVGLSPIVVTPTWLAIQTGQRIGDRITSAHVKLPSRGQWFQAVETEPTYKTFTTESGLQLTVPTGHFGRCWSAVPPCTPNPSPKLRLRVPGRPEQGFTVDGLWMMRDWPEPWRPNLLSAMRRSWQKRSIPVQ